MLFLKCIVSLSWGLVPWQFPQEASFRVPLSRVRSQGAMDPRWICSQIRGLILCVLSAVRGDFRKEVSSSALSVLINPKDPHAVQLWQLGDEYSEQGNSVDHKMGPIVFGVEAG